MNALGSIQSRLQKERWERENEILERNAANEIFSSPGMEPRSSSVQ